MTEGRWQTLFDDLSSKLTTDEINEGWHWCQEFDGLLVGPGMSERQFCGCSCPNVPLEEREKLQKEFNEEALM